MLRIRLQTDRYSGGAIEYAGDEVELPAAEAQRLIAIGQAVPLETPVETATVGPPELRGQKPKAESGKRKRPPADN